MEEHPEGKVLWHGWLEKGKSAASPLANTWLRKYCAVHLAEHGPLLSLYDSSRCRSMHVHKGGHVELIAAAVSQSGTHLQLTTVDEAGSKKFTNTRFRADTAEEAASCAAGLRAAIHAAPVYTLVPSSSSVTLVHEDSDEEAEVAAAGFEAALTRTQSSFEEIGDAPSLGLLRTPSVLPPPSTLVETDAELPAEQLQRQLSGRMVEAARDAERERQLAEEAAA